MTVKDEIYVRSLGYKLARNGLGDRRLITIQCERCGSGWTYPEEKKVTAAVWLRLIDHKAGHDGGVLPRHKALRRLP